MQVELQAVNETIAATERAFGYKKETRNITKFIQEALTEQARRAESLAMPRGVLYWMAEHNQPPVSPFRFTLWALERPDLRTVATPELPLPDSLESLMAFEQLFARMPTWRPLLNRLAETSPAWAALVAHWDWVRAAVHGYVTQQGEEDRRYIVAQVNQFLAGVRARAEPLRYQAVVPEAAEHASPPVTASAQPLATREVPLPVRELQAEAHHMELGTVMPDGPFRS